MSNQPNMKAILAKMKEAKKPSTVKVLSVQKSQEAKRKSNNQKRINLVKTLVKMNSSPENAINFSNITNNTDFSIHTILTIDGHSIITKTKNLKKHLKYTKLHYGLKHRIEVHHNVEVLKLVRDGNEYYRLMIPFPMILSGADFQKLQNISESKLVTITINRTQKKVHIIPSSGNGSYETDVDLYRVRSITLL